MSMADPRPRANEYMLTYRTHVCWSLKIQERRFSDDAWPVFNKKNHKIRFAVDAINVYEYKSKADCCSI